MKMVPEELKHKTNEISQKITYKELENSKVLKYSRTNIKHVEGSRKNESRKWTERRNHH